MHRITIKALLFIYVIFGFLPVFAESPFSEDFHELALPNAVYDSGACFRSLVVPVDLNGDSKKDLLVHYWCNVQDFGSVHSSDDPTPDALMVYITQSDGTFRVGNEEIFGHKKLSLGGATRNYDLGDFNNDGVIDVAFAVNYEDGRPTQNMPDVYSQQTIVISNKSYFEISRLGEPVWGHGVGVASNELGYDDVIFQKPVDWSDGGSNIQAFRYLDGSWQDVTDKYPKTMGNLAFGAKKTHDGSATNYLYQNSNGGGVRLYTKQDNTWTDKVVGDIEILDVDFKFRSWSKDLIRGRLTYENGKYYVNLGIADIKILETTSDEHFYIIGKYTGQIVGDSFDIETIYDENELELINILTFYQVKDGEITKIESPIKSQEIFDFYNFFYTKDINNDGLDDIFISYQSGRVSGFAGQIGFDGGSPRTYLQSQSGKFIKIDTSDFPKGKEDGTQLGKYSDLNNDGYVDLIIYNTASNVPIRIHYGISHMNYSDDDDDGIEDGADNCVGVSNENQLDTDKDLKGDVCDEDDDNDGVLDSDDTFPKLASENSDLDKDLVGDNADNCPNVSNNDQLNTDSDAEGDVCDIDDDNDGFTDLEEVDYGSDPLNKSSEPVIDGMNLILIKAVLDLQQK